ncbi:MAG: DUF3788 family protein [Bacteroidales bacterium]|nr:DUF3788 family protein [Bacteroidales bacterium]
MEKLLLKDPLVYPGEDILAQSLGEIYPVYAVLVSTITSTDFNLAVDWNYYKDGKAWLCKVSFKKKTIFWLSVWEKHFNVSFYFTEKTKSAIETMAVSEKIKKDFNQSKAIGKLIPLTLNIEKEEQLPDLLKIVTYKKQLK